MQCASMLIERLPLIPLCRSRHKGDCYRRASCGVRRLWFSPFEQNSLTISNCESMMVRSKGCMRSQKRDPSQRMKSSGERQKNISKPNPCSRKCPPEEGNSLNNESGDMFLNPKSDHQTVRKSYCNAVGFCSVSAYHLDGCSA